MERKMENRDNESTKMLKDAARKATYEIFSLGFGLRLGKYLEEGVEPEKTIGDLLVGVVEEELQDHVYAVPGGIDIPEAHRSKSPLTKNYSKICKQALDLYLERRM